jgi:putative membrane protein
MRRPFGFLLGAQLSALSFLLVACEPDARNERDGAPVDAGARRSDPGRPEDAGARRSDRTQIDLATFVQKAASSGKYEVQSSELAAGRSSGPVQEFARKMIEDHKAANEKLREAASAQGVQVQDTLLAEHRQMFDGLQNLQGQEFDRTYIQQQRTEHEKGVELFETASRSLPEGALRQFAAETLPTLRQHLEHVRSIDVGGR